MKAKEKLKKIADIATTDTPKGERIQFWLFVGGILFMIGLFVYEVITKR